MAPLTSSKAAKSDKTGSIFWRAYETFRTDVLSSKFLKAVYSMGPALFTATVKDVGKTWERYKANYRKLYAEKTNEITTQFTKAKVGYTTAPAKTFMEHMQLWVIPTITSAFLACRRAYQQRKAEKERKAAEREAQGLTPKGTRSSKANGSAATAASSSAAAAPVSPANARQPAAAAASATPTQSPARPTRRK